MLARNQDGARARRKSSLRGQAWAQLMIRGSCLPSPTPRLRRSPARAPVGERSAPGPQRSASGPPRAKFNFAGAAAAWGPRAGAGSPRRDRERAYLCRSLDGHRGRPGREVPAARAAGREVGGPAPSHVPTSRPPGRAHGPGREHASAHAPHCLPPRAAAARRARAERGRVEVPVGGPAARLPLCPGAAAAPGASHLEERPPGPRAGLLRGEAPLQGPEPLSFLGGPRAFVRLLGQKSAPGLEWGTAAVDTTSQGIWKRVPGPGRLEAVCVDERTLPWAGDGSGSPGPFW